MADFYQSTKSLTKQISKTNSKIKLKFEPGTFVAPGDRIGSIHQISSGDGTYIRGNIVHVSRLGKFELDSSNLNYLPVAKVVSAKKSISSFIIYINQVVMGKIQKLTMKYATIEIMTAEYIGALPEPHWGWIRKEDIRKDFEDIPINECFQVNDIVVCRIISLGDNRRYYCSTAELELGVVRAVHKTSGKLLLPINTNEMQCLESKDIEKRKCAKPHNLSWIMNDSCGKIS